RRVASPRPFLVHCLPSMRKKILFSASVFHALTDASTVVIPTIFPILYNRGFLITRYSQIGLLSNLGLIATVLFQFVVVRLSYRRDYRIFLLASGLGICACLALTPLAGSFFVLLLFFLLLRLAASVYHPLIIAWISKSAADSDRELDRAMGIQSGSGNVGVMTAYLTVGFLAQRWTWKTPLFAWAGLGLLLVLAVLLTLRGVPSQNEETRPLREAQSWIRSLAAVKRFVPGFFFGGMGWNVTVFFAPSLLNHRFGVPMGQTGLFLALWMGIGTITGYSYGSLSRRFGRKKLFLTTLAGSAACLVVLGWSPIRGLAVAALLVFGGLLLMTYPSLHTFVGSTVRPEEQTRAFSWVSNIQMISGALVALVSGFLSDAAGIHLPFLLAAALTLGVFIFYLPRGPEFFGGRSERAAGPGVNGGA
ncbi:MAG TPA: MFS transporter, partial [Candidatus Aminicenantes bacterium]|nr:MFS transporter [Candidatus Aminicenantes bacterium]